MAVEYKCKEASERINLAWGKSEFYSHGIDLEKRNAPSWATSALEGAKREACVNHTSRKDSAVDVSSRQALPVINSIVNS
ncbi:hypothetical protein KIN20_025415 [Parelaphostrongylus tenuis]|uniref:Uncharacterized protein n=1 Tax=Parelaphostrongylus tenuis TaxID=148309 RepID=A0AAD5N8T8_PARTN|nr:hypothetical protein KIN20_025415 [Parelaphostrongylus tenuis]